MYMYIIVHVRKIRSSESKSNGKSETEGISISEEILENVGSKSKRPSKVTGKNLKPMALTFKPTTQGQKKKKRIAEREVEDLCESWKLRERNLTVKLKRSLILLQICHSIHPDWVLRQPCWQTKMS